MQLTKYRENSANIQVKKKKNRLKASSWVEEILATLQNLFTLRNSGDLEAGGWRVENCSANDEGAYDCKKWN